MKKILRLFSGGLLILVFLLLGVLIVKDLILQKTTTGTVTYDYFFKTESVDELNGLQQALYRKSTMGKEEVVLTAKEVRERYRIGEVETRFDFFQQTPISTPQNWPYVYFFRSSFNPSQVSDVLVAFNKKDKTFTELNSSSQFHQAYFFSPDLHYVAVLIGSLPPEETIDDSAVPGIFEYSRIIDLEKLQIVAQYLIPQAKYTLFASRSSNTKNPSGYPHRDARWLDNNTFLFPLCEISPTAVNNYCDTYRPFELKIIPPQELSQKYDLTKLQFIQPISPTGQYGRKQLSWDDHHLYVEFSNHELLLVTTNFYSTLTQPLPEECGPVCSDCDDACNHATLAKGLSKNSPFLFFFASPGMGESLVMVLKKQTLEQVPLADIPWELRVALRGAGEPTIQSPDGKKIFVYPDKIFDLETFKLIQTINLPENSTIITREGYTGEMTIYNYGDKTKWLSDHELQLELFDSRSKKENLKQNFSEYTKTIKTIIVDIEQK